MNKKHLAAASLIIALLAGVGWALFAGEDAELAEMKQMRDDMLKNIDTMSGDERRAARDAFREKTENLSQDQRRELGRGFRRFFKQRIDKLLAMPREEQVAELDKLIDRMEEFQRHNDGQQRSWGGGDMSQAQRDQRNKQRLDRTSPDMRAKFDLMKDLINDRRQERGMKPMEGPPRGMFGGPRR